MAHTKAAAKVGAVVVGATVLLAAVAWFFLGRGIGGYPVDVTFKDAQGTKEGADVRLAGVKVGTVNDIAWDPTSRRAVLHLRIFPDHPVPRDADYTLTSGGLLGEMFVQIMPLPTGRPGDYLPKTGKNVPLIHGTDLPTFDDLKLKAAQLGTGASDIEVNMKRISERLAVLAEDPYYERTLKSTAANVNYTSQQAALAAKRIGDTLDKELPTLQAMLHDVRAATAVAGPTARNVQTMSYNATQISGNVNRVVKNLNESVTFLRQTVSDTLKEAAIGPQAKVMLQHITEASENFKNVAADAQKIADDLASTGESTSKVGQLITSVEVVSKKVSTLLDKISGVASKAGGARGPHFTLIPSVDAYQSVGQDARFRADVNLAIPRGPDAAFLLGLYDLGEANKLNLQSASKVATNAQFRYGVHASRLGVGMDLMLDRKPWSPGLPLQKGSDSLSADLYNPNYAQLDIYARRQIRENVGLSIGMQDVLHRGRPTIGLTYRQ